MKKFLALTCFLFFVFSFALFTGCAPDSGSNPDPAPTATPTPYQPTHNEYIDNFTDQDMVNNLGYDWILETDSGDGNNSTIDASSAAQSYLSVTATLKANLSESTSDYTSLIVVADKVGYIKFSTSFGEYGLNMTANNLDAMNIRSYFSSAIPVGMYVMIHGANGGYVVEGPVSGHDAWWYSNIFYSNLSVPSGAAYTVNDVISKATKLEIIFKYADTAGNSLTTNINIDNIYFFQTP